MSEQVSPRHVNATVATRGVKTPSGDGPENATDKIAAFMSRVVPWPADNRGSGFINVHWHLPGKPFRGRSVANIDEMISAAQALTATRSNIYFCLSQQAVNGGTRTAKNAVALKAIWLDIDVKNDLKAYATIEEAEEALEAFIKQYALPKSTAIVRSGGGLHVYWISDRPLTVEEWTPYAFGLRSAALEFGLRCDAGVTTDPARVLRIPGTANFKTDPPKPVKLVRIAEIDYDFEQALAPLRQLGGTDARRTVAPLLGKLAPAFASLPVEGFSDCLTEFPPLKAEPIFAGCAWLRTALETGGKDYDEPQWYRTIRCATYLENGYDLAHRMGNKHPKYSPAGTDEKWNHAVRGRDNKGLGWPQCHDIEANGSTACAGCPFRIRDKSPLHLALPSPTFDVAAIFGEVREGKLDPVTALMTLRDQGADIDTLLAAMNQTYAVVKYGGQVMIAIIIGDDISFMKVEDFHKMFANLVDTAKAQVIKVSKYWFGWKKRRRYLGRGVVFEPGGPLEVENDMLNLWRGFGIAPKPGDWSLLRAHIFNVVCSENPQLFDYLIKWMAYAVQHPDKPIGVAVAFLGPQGAGKGVVARTFGKFFGKHFVHITHGDQLTGRFNASLGTSCAVFLDEALWAGDKKAEGTLKALITEPSFQMEAKFRDPIMVDNRLRIMVASNNDWAVPTGVRDRRWFVLTVANTYAGTGHRDYWTALYAEIENGGAGAMLHDLLAMDLSGFDVRAIPHTTAKAQQQMLSLHGTMSWLYHVLQEGSMGMYNLDANGTLSKPKWDDGLTISKDVAYAVYQEFSKQRHEWHPEIKDVWSKKIRNALSPCVEDVRQTIGEERVRSLKFASLADCRRQFETHVGAPNIEWEEPENEPGSKPGAAAMMHTVEDISELIDVDAQHDAFMLDEYLDPSIEWEPELEPENWPEYEPEYKLDCEAEYEPEYVPE